MPRTTIRYARRDPAEEARKQTASSFQQQRQAQASAYAAAKFQEWQANAQQREQNLQYRNQILQSQAEMVGLKTQKDLYNQGEIDRETKMYLAGIPMLREQLKNANIKPGSNEYRAEISAFAQHIPHAFASNPDIRKDLSELSHVDATAAEIADKIKTFKQGMVQAGQEPGPIHLTKGGEITGEGRSGIPENVIEHYAKSQSNIRALTEEKIASETAGKTFDAKELHANQIQSSILERNYPKLKAPVPQQPQQPPQPLVAPQAATSPTPVGIEIGTQRTANGQTVEWDGQGWSAVQQ